MVEDVKEKSIRDYLTSRGLPNNGEVAGRIFYKSPFTRDTNYSLCVYLNTNSFYDWSQGFGGSIVDLVMAMESLSFKDAVKFLTQQDYSKYKPNYKLSEKTTTKQFEFTRFLTQDLLEVTNIREYANSRGFVNGFEYCIYPELVNNKWERVQSIGFPHRDENGVLCGFKFRRIDGKEPRFSARGKMGFYILEYVDPNNFGEPTLYVVEGEGNANSLWQYCQETKRNCVVISFGGVGSLPNNLPNKYDYIKDRKLIIDFDGDEELYNKRLSLYKDYILTPIKLVLPKKEDINSLYLKKEIKLLNSIL